MQKTEFLGLLKNRNFMLLWGEQILSQFAYNLVNFALIVWVYKISNSSFAESLLVLSFILPTAIFSVFTGVVADLFDRRKIMLLVHGVWAIFILTLVLVKDSLPLILIFSFVLNTIDRFFTPAEQASLPNIVPKEDLLFATSLFSFSLNAGFLLGFSLAGPLMLLLGNNGPFFIASFLIVLGLIFIWLLPSLKSNLEKGNEWKKYLVEETLLQIKNGYLFVKKTKIILWAIIIFSFLQIGMNGATALVPSFVVKTLGYSDPKDASWVVMLPVGLGSILAIILLRFWQHNLKRVLISRGFLIAGIALLFLGTIPVIRTFILKNDIFLFIPKIILNYNWTSIMVFIAAGFLGLSATLMIVPTLTIISQYTPNEYLGRVWGVANLVQNTAAVLPLVLLGAVADRISVLPLIFIFAFLSIILYTVIYSTRMRVFFKTKKLFSELELLFPIK